MNKPARVTLGAMAMAAGIAFSLPALAQTTLTVSTWGGPNHGINTIVWPTWGAWVEEATEGRVSVEVVHDMGPPAAQMALVADGIGDASWIFHGFTPGRFELTKVPEFPTFEDFSSEVASAAYWRTHQEYLAQAGEHRGVDVVAVGVHGPGQIFTSQKVETLGALEEQRIRVGGGVMAGFSNELGMSGVALPPTGIYEAASQGVIDGAMMSLEGLRSFRIAEVLPHTLSVEGGFYRGSFSIAMNPMFWDRVTAEDRDAILAVSGEPLSRLFGHMMDVVDASGVAFAEEQGNTFTALGEADIERLRAIADEQIADWSVSVAERSEETMAAVEYFRAQLGEAAKGESIAARVVRNSPHK